MPQLVNVVLDLAGLAAAILKPIGYKGRKEMIVRQLQLRKQCSFERVERNVSHELLLFICNLSGDV